MPEKWKKAPPTEFATKPNSHYVFNAVQVWYTVAKDSDVVIGILLGILGVAAAIKASEKTCPHCSQKIRRGRSQCPMCGNRV